MDCLLRRKRNFCKVGCKYYLAPSRQNAAKTLIMWTPKKKKKNIAASSYLNLYVSKHFSNDPN